jgi:hypothetical protein
MNREPPNGTVTSRAGAPSVRSYGIGVRLDFPSFIAEHEYRWKSNLTPIPVEARRGAAALRDPLRFSSSPFPSASKGFSATRTVEGKVSALVFALDQVGAKSGARPRAPAISI